MTYVLGPNQYGKAENRVVRIYRDTARHEIRDLNVSSALRGDFTDAHVTGDQANVLPTDTQKNTAFAFAKQHGITSPEDYALALGSRFLDVTPAATASRVEVEEYAWDRIDVGGQGHDHAFARRGGEVRTTVVTQDRSGDTPRQWVVSGLKDLVVLKSTGSEFKGFLQDEYTTLQETDDRILATSLVARWRYETTEGVDWNKSFDDIRTVLLETFATTYSHALQQSLYAMGSAVLETHPEVAEIKFSAPNKHHFLVDLSPFGVENDGEVFIAADRPYGLIEATVQREGGSDAGDAWLTVPGFC
ncbi:factor-independent urate hydroxylase [Phycicoccus sp. 3266]|jgi:urate oxidase|uniref:factor-independent urate hydroxylase n=1 Tax=Phycicoccus sp. 3266 TaxID=2817751 RepID=UPI0028545F2D|nr:urate oxidase [Phycicoccus sp. 3266]MDR6863565.1 urate oxidase [Phycicoccus sp. 3266]